MISITRTSHYVTSATIALLFLTALPAEAVLYLTSDAQFGPNSVTVDTSTGLGWLNLTETAGLSYQQVLSEMQVGGMFSGFRFATVPEVLDLYTSAGIGGTGYYPFSTPSIQSLFSLIGTTGTFNGYPGLLALSGTLSATGGYCAPAIYVAGQYTGQEYWVNDGGFETGGTAYGATTSYPQLSSWLVKSVPEPSDTILLILAAPVWCGFRLLHRREKATQHRAGAI